MEVRQRGLMAGLLMATLVMMPVAEAKRAGGGKSHGMSRSATPSKSYQQPRQATPVQQPSAAPKKSGPGVGTMVAAGVAGAAVGAVAMNALADDDHKQTNDAELAKQQQAAQQQEEESGGLGWLWFILAAGAAFFLFLKFAA